MKERLNDPSWSNPNTGKSMTEITGDPNYVNPTKGRTAKEIRGADYIDPRSKPFTVTVNDSETYYFECESQFINQLNIPGPTLTKLKRNRIHTIKRQKNSRHKFKTGDVLKIVD